MDLLERAKQKLKESNSATIISENKIIPEEKKKLPESNISSNKKTIPLHILNEENLIRFIKEQEKTKPYEMKIRFYENSSFEIQKLIKKLYKKGLLSKNKSGWIKLKK